MWFTKSNTNLCFVEYPNTGKYTESQIKYIYLAVKYRMKAVQIFVGNFLREAINNGNITFSQIMLSGFSLGVHIASYICRYLKKFFKNELIPVLLGQ